MNVVKIISMVIKYWITLSLKIIKKSINNENLTSHSTKINYVCNNYSYILVVVERIK